MKEFRCRKTKHKKRSLPPWEDTQLTHPIPIYDAYSDRLLHLQRKNASFSLYSVVFDQVFHEKHSKIDKNAITRAKHEN